MHPRPRRTIVPAALAASALTLGLAGIATTASLKDRGPVDLEGEFDGRVDGAAGDDAVGVAIAPAGDFNNDGDEDFIVGAPGAARAYVVFGGESLGTVDLGALGSDGVTITGPADDALGAAVAAAGDVNDDGIDDVIVGDPDADTGPGTDSGSAHVVYGSATPPTAIDVATLAPATTGFTIFGATTGEDAGTSVAGVGDVNDDGVDDVVVGSEQFGTTPSTGRADVIFGTPSSGTPADVTLSALGAAGVTFTGDADDDQAGEWVGAAGDIDGDGTPDLVIGAPENDTGGTDSGSVYVVFGSDTIAGGTLGSLPAGAEIEISGAAAGDNTGRAAAGAGDVNDDGIDDLIIGSPDDAVPGSGSPGSATVIFGSETPGDVALDSLGAGGVLITGSGDGDLTGFRVSGNGDVNGDGIADVLIGSSDDDDGGTDAGSVHVIFGADGLSGTIDLGSVGEAGARIDAAGAGDSVRSVALAPDLNGDGKQDVLVGTPFAGNNGSGSGSAYVVDGFSVTTAAYTATSLAGGAAASLTPDVTANGTATFAATGLPTGLAIDAATGRITGTPTVPGTFNATIIVTDNTGANPVPVAFSVSSGLVYPPAALTRDVAASLVPATAAAGTPRFAATGLPDGLAINAASGAISGTPTALGSSSVVVTMSDDNGPVSTTISLTVSLPPPDGTPAPSPRSGDFLCSGRTLRFRESTPGTVRVTRQQLLTNQRIAQAAIRRLAAIENWLNAGVEARDLCGHAFSGSSFDAGVATEGNGPTFDAVAADPRPLRIAGRRSSRPDAIMLTRGQLTVNQRVYQVALLRARALKRRIGGRLTGGDLVDDAVTPGKLVPGTRILSLTPPGSPVAKSLTERVTAKKGSAEGVRLTTGQLRINQAIARKAIEETNALRARLTVGLSSDNFAADSIAANQIADASVIP